MRHPHKPGDIFFDMRRLSMRDRRWYRRRVRKRNRRKSTVPKQPQTEEDVLDLIAIEEQARRNQQLPEYIVAQAESDIRRAFAEGWTFVGAAGGLRWSAE